MTQPQNVALSFSLANSAPCTHAAAKTAASTSHAP